MSFGCSDFGYTDKWRHVNIKDKARLNPNLNKGCHNASTNFEAFALLL